MRKNNRRNQVTLIAKLRKAVRSRQLHIVASRMSSVQPSSDDGTMEVQLTTYPKVRGTVTRVSNPLCVCRINRRPRVTLVSPGQRANVTGYAALSFRTTDQQLCSGCHPATSRAVWVHSWHAQLRCPYHAGSGYSRPGRVSTLQSLSSSQATGINGLCALQKKAAPSGEKPEPVRTHLRDVVVLPEMIGSLVGVYNGKTFNQVEIKVRVLTPGVL